LWIIYRDGDGRQIQENSGTEDRDEALRILAVKAIEQLRGRIERLEAFAYEGKKAARKTDHDGQPAGRSGERGTGGGSVRALSKGSARKTAKKGGRA
jgi:hypothetical protein